MEPQYKGLDKDDIPTISKEGVVVQVLSGNVEGTQGPFESVTGVTFTTVSCAAGSTHGVWIFLLRIPSSSIL
jgi:redox-sensitive bicupin YhaK (pirin superfamily)